MKYVLIVVAGLILLGAGYYYFMSGSDNTDIDLNRDQDTAQEPVADSDSDTDKNGDANSDDTSQEPKTETVLGTSVDGNEILAYHYGTGDKELLFIGGIHGGYSWNTSLVAFDLMDYLKANPDVIPKNVRVTVIPIMNPDGLDRVVGTTKRFVASAVPAGADTVPGRFNGNDVDLNRNFDCGWQQEGTWQTRSVSGGSAPFSEPESKAIQAYVESHDIAGALVWYSAAGGVYASACGGEVLPKTTELTNLYAKASGYPAHEKFDFYEITGDMVNWFAKQKIPAISVLLTDRTNPEWNKNRAGIDAMLTFYAKD